MAAPQSGPTHVFRIRHFMSLGRENLDHLVISRYPSETMIRTGIPSPPQIFDESGTGTAVWMERSAPI
jgi:hypothetical protein